MYCVTCLVMWIGQTEIFQAGGMMSFKLKIYLSLQILNASASFCAFIYTVPLGEGSFNPTSWRLVFNVVYALQSAGDIGGILWTSLLLGLSPSHFLLPAVRLSWDPWVRSGPRVICVLFHRGTPHLKWLFYVCLTHRSDHSRNIKIMNSLSVAICLVSSKLCIS